MIANIPELLESFKEGLAQGVPKEQLYTKLGKEFDRSADTIRRQLQKAGALERRRKWVRPSYEISKCNRNAQDDIDALLAITMSFGQNQWQRESANVLSKMSDDDKKRAVVILERRLAKVSYEYSKLKSAKRLLTKALDAPITLSEGQNHVGTNPERQYV